MWKELFLLVLSQCIGAEAGDQITQNETVLAIPFLFPYHLKDNCSQLYPPGNTNQYSFLFTSHYKHTPTFAQQLTINIPEDDNAECVNQIQWFADWTFGTAGTYTNQTTMITHDEHCKDLQSICYLCKNNVMGFLAYFRDNPGLSMIAQLFGEHFNHSLAVYPLTHTDGDPPNTTYTYRVLFGTPQQGILDGISIEVLYSHTNIIIRNAAGAIALRNGHRVFNPLNKTFELWEQCENTVIWIEPTSPNCRDTLHTTTPNLQDAVIEASLPIKVFTNHAQCNDTGWFSFQSKVVHEMPLAEKWGQQFVLDIQQARLLPEEISTLTYGLSILSSELHTEINVTYHYESQALHVEQYKSLEDIVHINKTQSFISTLTHIEVSSTKSILLLYDINSPQSLAVHYSIIVQPVSWFSNIQTLALSSINGSSQADCSYHISIVIPTEHSNPNDILISSIDTLQSGKSVSTFDGFKSFTSDGFTLMHISPSYHAFEDNYALIWHTNPSFDIGTTVFAYCSHRHYAYSNGYVAENSSRDLLGLPPETSSSIHYRLIIIILALLFAAAAIVLATVCCYRRRKSSKTYYIRNDDLLLVSEEPGTDYEYDVFILFTDEDEGLVHSFIYEPLRRRCYKILWRNDQLHDLFRVGGDSVEDLARAIEISRKIVVVCTRYFGDNLERDVSFFKDVQMSERKRRLIPFVIEEEFKSPQFSDYNQIRIRQREDLLANHELTNEILQKLINSIGEPLDASQESLVYL